MKIHLHDVYNIEGNEIKLSSEYKNGLVEGLQIYIQELVETDENLNLTLLKYIFVTNKYGDELADFQRDKGIKEGFTKNEVGEGFAMTLTYFNEEGEKEIAIFFRPEIVLGLFVELPEEFDTEQNMAINTFYHELCHVSDDYYLRESVDISTLNSMDVLAGNLYTLSLSSWQEYYAYRKSSERFPYGDLMIPHLEETIEWVSKDTHGLKEKFFKDNNMDEFMQSFYLNSKYLFRVIVAVMGNIHGINLEQVEKTRLLETTKINLESIDCGEEFSKLAKELDFLFTHYPWEGLESLSCINSIFLDFWKKLGVSPRLISHDKMYVEIM